MRLLPLAAALAVFLLAAPAWPGTAQAPAQPEGEWTVTRFVFAPFPEISEADAKTWIGKKAHLGKDRIVFDGSLCKVEGFERRRIDPSKYFESFDTDPNLLGACGREAVLIRTRCEDSPFSEFVFLGAENLIVFWEGAFFVLARQ